MVVETDGRAGGLRCFCIAWRLYARKVVGWCPSYRLISNGYHVVAELVPDANHKRYEIAIDSGVTEERLATEEELCAQMAVARSLI